MTVHDKTRLIGRLRRFFRHDEKSPKVCSANLGPPANSLQFPAPDGAPPLLKGLLLRLIVLGFGCPVITVLSRGSSALRRQRRFTHTDTLRIEPPLGDEAMAVGVQRDDRAGAGAVLGAADEGG